MRIVDHFLPHVPKPDPGPRNAKGEWRPPYATGYPPVCVWPPRPVALFKWLFNWAGFFLPHTAVFLLISALAWRYTEPDLARCTEFKWDWLLQIWVRNLALTWLVYGGYHLYLYVLKGEGTKRKFDARWPARNSGVFLFRDQVLDNIFWTSGVAVLIWTAYEAIGLWLFANHHIPFLSWKEHPVWFVAWFFAMPLWRDIHFYWTHRALHWKPLYRYVHYLHHKNANPIPWSGMAMHPVELIIYLSMAMIHWVVASHPFHFLFNLQYSALGPAVGHHGFEGPLLDGKWPTGSYFHYMHHRYFECNYGAQLIPFDKWFGTFRDGQPEGVGAGLQEEHRYGTPSNQNRLPAK